MHGECFVAVGLGEATTSVGARAQASAAGLESATRRRAWKFCALF